MASGSSQTPASSSAPNSALIWDVFLSYRGPDTGPTFTAHLYKALNDHRIKTFKDDYKLRQGEVLPKALRTAIKESKIYIVVFSEDYAFYLVPGRAGRYCQSSRKRGEVDYSCVSPY